MPLHSRENLKNQLRKKDFAPVYFLYGAETYLRDLAIKTIRDIALRDASLREFNENQLSLQGHDIADALAAAEQIPMMGDLRVILVSDVVISASKGRDTIIDDDEDILNRYLDNPTDSTILILIGDQMDGRRKMFKLLKKKAYAVEFKTLNENELLVWLRSRINTTGVHCDDRVLRYLIDRVGYDARKVTVEFDKLMSAALPDGEVTIELIDSLTPISRELVNFDLTDRLIENRSLEAIRVCRRILDDGVQPIALVGLLSFSFHRLLMAKSLMEQGANEGEVFAAINMHPRTRGKFLQAARRAKLEKLTNAITKLGEVDLALKSSTVPQRLVLEMLVCEIAELN